jgi:hypothetical protein
MPMNLKSDPKLEAIFAALENPRYEWRTVNGVATDTKLTREEVLEGLIKLIDADLVIRSEVPSAKGEELFTTRDHYKHFAPISKRLSAALRNRAS